MMWKKVGLFFILPMVLTACAGSYQSGKYNSKHYVVPKSDIPLVMNDRVAAWIDYFTGPGRDRFARYLKRSGRYEPMIRQTMQAYGVPQDLLYLAMIESGFSSKAKSHASAVGVWQFIRATGNRYGLEQDTWIDERQDAEKETHAAAQYLRDLYNEFGDWYLAMAGYNAGEGTVRRAVSRYGTKNFWELSEPRKNAFRAETRDYVPKFIAAATIGKNPEKYGFTHVERDPAITYDEVTVNSPVDLEVVAQCAGTDLETIDILNSELRIGTAPTQYRVRVPAGSGKKFHLALAKIPVDDRVQSRVAYEKHVVAKGETLRSISRRYGVKSGSILAASGLKNARAVKRGATLTIPVGGVSVARMGESRLVGRTAPQLPGYRDTELKSFKVMAQKNQPLPESPQELIEETAPASSVAVMAEPAATGYVVSVGDSWNSISENLGIPTKVLKELNPEVASTGLHVGDVLQLKEASDVAVSPVQVAEEPLPRPKKSSERTLGKATKPISKKGKVITYKVKPGDNLWTIGKKHNISPAQMKQMAGTRKGGLKPGDVLTLRVGS